MAVLFYVLCVSAASARAADWFVATNGNDSAVGTNWATAKLTIQAAIDAAVSNDTVWVSNGVYATGERVVAGSTQTNRVAITNAITLRSVNGPECTIIDGSNVVRVIYLVTNAVLDGFTVTRGQALTGGGVYCNGAAVVTNCHIVQNVVSVHGGGVAFGKVRNCVISGNTSSPLNTNGNYGGGTYFADVQNSLINSNIVDSSNGAGGGTYGGTASNCLIGLNNAYSGGGSANGLAENCVITNNTARYGGGSFNNTNRNCLIMNNEAWAYNADSYGGGAYACWLDNCTVCRNIVAGAGWWQAFAGSGTFNCTNSNSIIYFNFCAGGTTSYSCAESVLSGTGNITNAPCFADGYHLLEQSPCVNTGTNLAWAFDATDLDGRLRIQGGRIDMGCYALLSGCLVLVDFQ